LVFSLLLCGAVYAQAEANEAAAPVVNVALAGIDKVYVKVLPDKATAIDSDDLEKMVTEKLTAGGLKVVPAAVADSNDKEVEKMMELLQREGVAAKNVRLYSAAVPELIVRVSVLQGAGASPCVYHIQTSFARQVRLPRVRQLIKAELWRADVPIGIADANQCEASIRSAVAAQADAFVAEWKRAAAARISAAREPTENATSAAGDETAQAQQEKEMQYPYVASKFSRVFHKAGCHAARIKPENLIGFRTRQEAIDSGRRPCQMCNP
jgi:hypothetical protein